MNVIIIEDELPARAKLISMLQTIDPSIRVVAELGSVKETSEWLSKHIEPDLAFVDIQLSDDHSFEIFRKHPVKFPVIFTTAYDKYILESFEFNSIDYLLKPITEEKLKRSLDKIQKLEHFFQGNVLKLIQQQSPAKGRIVARKGTEFVALNADEIAYFFSDHKIVFVRDFQGRQMIVDKNLGELENELDPKTFFRVNRKFITHQKAIDRFKPDNGKIQIFLKPEMKEEVHVSKETAPEFRRWIGQ
ncbi:MAG TPA: LytTR family DNA-binding domain-containing protein [Cyclobacteriaceae bacterium]|nr:LytTR family DNA-binding domain-containing protein [Cyclobacteriaceae bacterium]HPW61714.1 LytTR family DNA-binding domain-containing protein [Cyclobacteriaceae bacterium]